VNLHTTTPTQAQLNQITSLQQTLHNAQQAADDVGNSAYSEYLADVRAQASHQAFGAWLTQHDPYYTSLQRQVQAADSTLQNYEVSVSGPQYRTITTQRNKIDNQARDELDPEPG
jgi:hypothetical protein